MSLTKLGDLEYKITMYILSEKKIQNICVQYSVICIKQIQFL